jgi:hypothetical protein
MMYSNQLVTAVKVNGKVLREFGDKVYIPFGSEYSLYFKNLNSRKAEVKVSIDGKDVLGGSSLIIDGNGDLNLERFLENLNKGNKFKFIERTSKIEQHRGIEAEDGLIRVEFQFEKEKPVVKYEDVHIRRHYWDDPYYWYDRPYWYRPYRSFMSSDTLIGSGASGGGGGSRGMGMGSSSAKGFAGSAESTLLACASTPTFNCAEPSAEVSNFVNDVGITTKGSESNQQFTTVAGLNLEDAKHVMILKLVGDLGKQKVTKAVTVKQKITCSMCGTKAKATDKCCSECGTSLKIF